MQFTKQSLLSQLTDFGLNPRDWRMEIKSLKGAVMHIHLFNKLESGLMLQGFADHNAWLDLSYQG